MKNSKTAIASIPGVDIDLTKIKAEGKELIEEKEAEAALVAISVRTAELGVEADEDKSEIKRLKAKLAESPVGKRMNQLAEKKKRRSSELDELKAGMKYLMKYFKDKGIKINEKKLNLLPQ